jgi:nucleotide-binding universal stress UspA family protein
MLQNILVALDDSYHAPHVFETALTLAKAMGSRLMILHVLSSSDKTSPNLPIMIDSPYYSAGISSSAWEAYQDLWQKYEEQGLAMLQSCTETALKTGVTAEFSQKVGSPDRVICELAHHLNSDLIVLGRRGYFGLNEFILGSVSNYVLHHAACSVFVVHAPIPAIAAPPVAEKLLTALI